MFANAPKLAKSTNIFFHEQFPIYDMFLKIFKKGVVDVYSKFFHLVLNLGDTILDISYVGISDT